MLKGFLKHGKRFRIKDFIKLVNSKKTIPGGKQPTPMFNQEGMNQFKLSNFT